MGCLRLENLEKSTFLKVLNGVESLGSNKYVSDYRYGFNGMETDNEVSGNGNSYTTQFRQYDPRLGRWKSLDPLMNSFPDMSPYVAFDNNPVYFTDPYGLASEGGPEKGSTHTVQKGETLTSIAKKYNTTIDKIVKLNNIDNPDEIMAGQILIIDSDPETVGSKAEHLASSITQRNGGAKNAEYGGSGDYKLTDEEKAVVNAPGGSVIANLAEDIIYDQAWLEMHHQEIGEAFEYLSNTLPNSELSNLQDERHRMKNLVQGTYMYLIAKAAAELAAFYGPTFKNTPRGKKILSKLKGVSGRKITFGTNPKSVEHAFRHTDAMGISRSVVKKAISNHLPSIVDDIAVGTSRKFTISAGGKNIVYSAHKFSNGSINVGRITPTGAKIK